MPNRINWDCSEWCNYRLSFTSATRRVFDADQRFFKYHAKGSGCTSCGPPPVSISYSKQMTIQRRRNHQNSERQLLAQEQGHVIRVNKKLHEAVGTRNNTLSLERLLNYMYVDIGDLRHRTALHVAASRADLAAAEVLLTYNANPRSKSQSGLTPLYFAVRSGCGHMVKRLVHAGADVNEIVNDYALGKCYSYLHYAVVTNDLQLAEILLDCGSKLYIHDCCGRTPLELAVRLSNNLELVHLLLDRLTKQSSSTDIGKILKNTLHVAVARGIVSIVCQLLNYGAVPDLESLRIAMICQDLRMLRLLVQKSRNLVVDATETGLHCLQRYWYGSLYQANEYWQLSDKLVAGNWHSQTSFRVSAARILLDSGMDVNARNAKYKTPLHLAVQEFNISGDSRLLTLLLENGADVEAQDIEGHTVIQLAGLGCLEKLLIYGARLDELLLRRKEKSPLRAWYADEEAYKCVKEASVKLEERWMISAVKCCARFAIKKQIMREEEEEERGDKSDEEMLKLMLGVDEIKRLEKECRREIDDMKYVWRYDNVVTAYKILIANKSRLIRYAFRSDVCGFIIFLRYSAVNELPNYADMLRKNLSIVLRYEKVVIKAKINLNVLCKNKLTNSILKSILCYLDLQDMNNLMKLRL